jgi:hypothetical protein
MKPQTLTNHPQAQTTCKRILLTATWKGQQDCLILRAGLSELPTLEQLASAVLKGNPNQRIAHATVDMMGTALIQLL